MLNKINQQRRTHMQICKEGTWPHTVLLQLFPVLLCSTPLARSKSPGHLVVSKSGPILSKTKDDNNTRKQKGVSENLSLLMMWSSQTSKVSLKQGGGLELMQAIWHRQSTPKPRCSRDSKKKIPEKKLSTSSCIMWLNPSS
jgi:hypothetical protein